MVSLRSYARDWRLFAAAGIALAVVGTASAQKQHPDKGRVQGAEAQQEAPPPVAAPVPPPVSPKIYEGDCRQLKSRDDANLCIARDSAEAAKDQASWARTSGIATWAGVAIGTFTLIAAGAAALYAKEAAIETKRGADVAEEAFRDFERPWIFVEKVHIVRGTLRGETDVPNGYMIDVSAKNIGRSAAIIDSVEIDFIEKEAVPAVPAYKRILRLGFDAFLLPEGSGQTTQVGPGQARLAEGEEASHYVFYGRLTYHGPNQRTYVTGFGYEVHAMFATAVTHGGNAYNYNN